MQIFIDEKLENLFNHKQNLFWFYSTETTNSEFLNYINRDNTNLAISIEKYLTIL